MIGGNPDCGGLPPPLQARPVSPDYGAETGTIRPPRPTGRLGHAAAAGRRTPVALSLVGTLTFLFFLLLPLLADAAPKSRFPPPDFSAGHVVPETVVPASEARAAGWIDVAALAAGLLLASWITLRTRSRAAIVVLSLAALAYFGFWRRGCVCAIGSIQNVALGVAEPGYAVPLAVIAFFTLPILTALIWGRGFCAGVCPHGAIQDLILVKPLKVPRWLDESLRILPWVYLAISILFAATGSLFLICKYDPFIGIFRMAGPPSMLILGAGMLLLAMFVGRPYCRYLCPYGPLLGLASRVARFRPTVAPDNCTQCRLCESSCPFEALNHPAPQPPARAKLAAVRRRAVLVAFAVPAAALLFAWLGGRVGLATTHFHPTGELAELVLLDESGGLPGQPPDEITAYRQAGADRAALFTAAAALEARALLLGRIIGALFGIVTALRIARVFFPESSPDYRTDATRCVSCARCFSACPYELARRGIPVDLPREGGGGA